MAPSLPPPGLALGLLPLTFETPKGLLEVFGERMIERQIKQLHEAGITDITIIVGYLKEKFEYLIDKYQSNSSITRSTPPKIIWLRSTCPRAVPRPQYVSACLGQLDSEQYVP